MFWGVKMNILRGNMRLNPSTLNITRVIITTSLLGAFISAPQPSAATAPTARQVYRPLVLAPQVQAPKVERTSIADPLAPFDSPTAVITSTGSSGAGPLLVSFGGLNSSSGITGSTALTFAWSFGDGLTSTLPAPTHIFPIAKSYNVTLTVTNSANQTDSKSITVTVAAFVNLPAPYTGINIGTFITTAVPGSRYYSTGPFANSLATCSNGIDIYTPPDDLRFVYQTMSNDGEISGRLVDLNRAEDTGKVGVMVRESLDDDAKYIFIGTDGVYTNDPWAANARFTYRAQWRTTTGENSENADVSSTFPVNELPRWFKISRVLNTFSTFLSADGLNWTLANSQTIPMPATVYAGYSVTSIDGVLPVPMNCAQFDGLAFAENPLPPIFPTAVLTATPTSGTAPLIVQLDGTGSSSAGTIPGIKGYLWNFGDGMTSTEATVIHVYPTAGSYNVNLTVTNYDNLTATADAAITVSAGVPTGTLPTPWVSQDLLTLLGRPGSSNLATFGTNNVLASCGSGLDIQGTDDQFRFDYYPLTGNGEIKARMLSMTAPTGAFGNKGGIMIREAATRDAKYVALLQNKQTNPNDSALRYQNRPTTGAETVNDYVEGYSEPKWMKIVRTGDTFVSYTATTGLDWTPVATITIAMSQTVLAGFAITSIDNNAVSCAVFDNISKPGSTDRLVFLPLLGR